MTKEEVINRINSSFEWFPKSYAGFLFGIHIQALGLSLGSKIIPYAIPYGFVYINRNRANHWDWFWNSDEMRIARQKILEQAAKSRIFTDSFLEAYNRKYEAYVSHFESIADTDLKS